MGQVGEVGGVSTTLTRCDTLLFMSTEDDKELGAVAIQNHPVSQVKQYRVSILTTVIKNP